MSDTHVNDDHMLLSVGSMPAVMPDDEEAMRLVFTEIGRYLRYAVGSPEVSGDEVDWIVPAIRLLRKNPALEETRHGNWETFEDVLNFRIKPGHEFTSDSVDLLLLENYLPRWAIFLRLREEFGLTHLAYQQRLPTDFNYAYFTFGAKGVLRQRKHLRPFTEALARELKAIYTHATDQEIPVLYQLEFPAELVFLAKLRLPWLQALAAPWLARQVLRNVAAVPAAADTGGHTCRGNLNRRSLIELHPGNVKVMIRLINAITERWPAGRAPMRYIHLPLASAEKPPPVARAFYLPLRKLKLNPATRLVAGILHEDLSLEDAQRIRGWIEELVGRPVDVAGTCGFGRCSVTDTLAMMRLGAELCQYSSAAI